MDFSKFACDRVFIESVKTPAERNLLIATYCHLDFRYISFPDVYYRLLNENAIMMLLGMIIGGIILGTAMRHLAKRSVAVPIQEIKNKYQVPSVLASFTLMSLTSFTMVKLNYKTGFEGDAHISVSQIVSAFVFTLTVALSFVAGNAPKEIILPRSATQKELMFSFAILALMLAFAFLTFVNWSFGLVILGVYGLYLFVSLKLAEQNKNVETANELGLAKKLDLDPIREDPGEESREVSEENRSGPASKQDIGEAKPPAKSKKNDEDMEFDFGDDLKPDVQEDDEDDDPLEKLGVWTKISQKFKEEKYEGFRGYIRFAVDVGSLAIVSDSSNPLMDSELRYVILSISVIFPVFSFGLLPFRPNFIMAAFLMVLVGVTVLNKFGLSPKIVDFVSDLAAILTGLSLINLSSVMLSDCLEFLSFYFSLNAVTSNSILAAPNSVLSYMFVNQGLIEIGESHLAALSIFAIANFQLIWTLALTVFRRSSLFLNDFDLLMLTDQKSIITGNTIVDNDRFLAKSHLMAAYLTIVLISLYLIRTDFTIGKRFQGLGLALFMVFAVYTVGHSAE